MTKRDRNKGRTKRSKPHSSGFRAVDSGAILNRLKLSILEYFRKTLPIEINDAHLFILVVNGHIWIPVEVQSVIKKKELTAHVVRYASFSGDLQYKSLAVSSEFDHLIHSLDYVDVTSGGGLSSSSGALATPVGVVHRTGRLLKKEDEEGAYAEFLDDENAFLYLPCSMGDSSWDRSERFRECDRSPLHFKGCSWLATFYSQLRKNAATTVSNEILTKSLLFLLLQDLTILYHNYVAPVFLQMLTDLRILELDDAVELLRKWTRIKAYSDERLIRALASHDLRRVNQSRIGSLMMLLIGRYNDIREIVQFVGNNPLTSHFLTDKAEFYAMLGLDFKKTNKLSRAKAAYELSFHYRDNGKYIGNYATILWRLGFYAEAEKLALQSAQQEKRKAYKYLRLGNINFALQNCAKAAEYYSLGMAENRGAGLDSESGQYHTAFIFCSFWNAIIGCCTAEDPGFDYASENQFQAVSKRETRYCVELYEFLKLLVPPTAAEQELLTRSQEMFQYLKESLTTQYGDDKDIYVWEALLDYGRIKHEWLADLIAERVCSLINVLSVSNPEEDMRLQINNKFKAVVLKLAGSYVNRFGNNLKALALLEFYNGVVFRFNLQAINLADLTEAKKDLERLSAKMYFENAESLPSNVGDTRKSFTVVDTNIASEFGRAYQRFFSVIRQYSISLESFGEYREMISAIAHLTAKGDEAVLEFVDETDLFGVFVVQKRTVTFIRLDSQQYSEAIVKFDREITRIESELLFEDYENDLHAILGRISELCYTDIFSKLQLDNLVSIRIVPVGRFHLLPFHALVVNGKHLVEEVTINYLNNITFFKTKLINKGSHLLVGNPEFIDRPLEGAEEEILAIQACLPKEAVGILMRNEATKERFLEVLKPHSNLHLACHAQFNDHYPMTSMFSLHPKDNKPGNNISAGEIVGWNLEECNFVYLSACESGKGKVLTGNEVMGIPRGFFMAGARNVICTMWALCDDYAPEIASNFYRHYLITGAVSESLNHALKNSIAAKIPIFAWAPFKLITMENPSEAERQEILQSKKGEKVSFWGRWKSK